MDEHRRSSFQELGLSGEPSNMITPSPQIISPGPQYVVVRERSSGIISVLAAIGAVVVVGGILLFIFGASVVSSVVPPKRQADSSYSSAPPQPTPVLHQIGEDVRVGYWTYRVNGGQWTPVIGDEFSMHRADAAYLLLDITARNDDASESTLPPMKLVNAKGQEFSESDDAIFVNGSFGPLKHLNPGVESRGIVVFDAPPGIYGLELGGGFESGAKAAVLLRFNPPAPTPVPQGSY